MSDQEKSNEELFELAQECFRLYNEHVRAIGRTPNQFKELMSNIRFTVSTNNGINPRCGQDKTQLGLIIKGIRFGAKTVDEAIRLGYSSFNPQYTEFEYDYDAVPVVNPVLGGLKMSESFYARIGGQLWMYKVIDKKKRLVSNRWMWEVTCVEELTQDVVIFTDDMIIE